MTEPPEIKLDEKGTVARCTPDGVEIGQGTLTVSFTWSEWFKLAGFVRKHAKAVREASE